MFHVYILVANINSRVYKHSHTFTLYTRRAGFPKNVMKENCKCVRSKDYEKINVEKKSNGSVQMAFRYSPGLPSLAVWFYRPLYVYVYIYWLRCRWAVRLSSTCVRCASELVRLLFILASLFQTSHISQKWFSIRIVVNSAEKNDPH